ncbi:DUF5017 domain-containing protein [Barnesiella viscericola]|uniref:DUF5017 domain-containing protein n=1 Tax=Barnesiella viscericola TaxID=397865 RepID=UPI0023564DF7|nr:DUF5017 domain-containing protein [Barnesiella viscericola]
MKNFTLSSWVLLAALSVGTFTSQAAYSGAGTFNKVNSADEITTGSYMLIANKKAMSNEFGGNKKLVPVDLEITGDESSMVDPDKSLVFEFEVANGVITIKNGNNIVGYASGTNFTYNTTANSDATKDQWTAENSDNGILLKNVSANTRCILLNNSVNNTGATSNAFGPYAESNATSEGYYVPTLFKLSESGLPSAQLAFTDGSNKTKIFTAGATFASPATTVSTSPIVYASSNTGVATIDDKGLVTLVAAGETEISASVAANDSYEGAVVSYTLKVINNSVTLPYSIDFKSGLGDWLNYSVKGNMAWESDPKYGVVAKGFGKGESETWLVSPAVAASSIEFSFSSWTKYEGPALAMLISFDFDPLTMDDPNEATWTDITSQAQWPTEQGKWTESGIISHNELQAPVRIAFKYIGGGNSDDSAQWEITDLSAQGENLSVSSATLNEMKVISGKGEIVVLSDKAEEIAIYSMTGMEVLRTQIVEGSNPISLPAGIYIVNGVKAIVF